MRTPSVFLATVFGVLAFSVAPAVAAAPEAPETKPATGVTATTATFHGLVNPHAPGKALGEEWLFFWGEPGSTTCQNYGIAPLEVGFAGTLSPEPEETPFPGLEENTLNPNSQYTYCLAARSSESEEWTYGNPESFKTLPAPPTVTSESAAPKATGVRIEATVNASNEPTDCRLQYGAAAVGENEVPCEPASVNGGSQGVAATVTGLKSKTVYHYRIVAENQQSRIEDKPVLGEELTFETIALPETPETLKATDVTGTTAKLEGVLNPNNEGEPGTYTFVYRQSPSECQGAGEKAAPEPAAPAVGHTPEPVPAQEVTGLLANTTYTYCLRAINRAEEGTVGAPQTFTTSVLVASVNGEYFDHVASSSAVVHGKVNPGGAPTSYFFEYGPTSTATYGSRTPTQNAGNSSEPVSVLAPIEGLTPDTKYHFRLVASHTSGPAAEGTDTEFSTFPAGPLELPDGRQFEIVSPLDNGDATVLTGSPVRAAPNGNAVTYIGTASPTAGNGEITIQFGQRSKGDNVYLASRSPGSPWSAADVQPGGLNSAIFQGFSSDLSTGILTSEEAVVPGAPNGPGHQALYSRDGANASYGVLEEHAQYDGSTPDGSHILTQGPGGLHDFVAGTPEAVSVLPDREPVTSAVLGSTTGDLEHVISNDGARIFWTDTTTGDLYVRENDTEPDARTVLIAEAARFQTASSNGAKVFFTSENELTADSTAAEGAPDLYEYNLETRTLTDLTIDSNPGEHANVVGVLGTNPTGSYVYFAAGGKLTNNTQAQECRQPSEDEGIGDRCNVYVVHEHETPKLVTTVATADGEGGTSFTAEVIYTAKVSLRFGDWVPAVGFRTAFVSGDGRRLVFESVEDLTGFHADGGREIYTYDFETGRTSCVSCNPSGASTINGGFFEIAHAELAASLNPTYQTQDISADGNRVFFESNEALVSQVTNEEALLPGQNTKGLTNVYEWEREGTEGGSCPIKEPASTSGGCIFLLSTGASSDISFFLDASESGDDVFLATRADLVPQDKGEVYEVYDAHQCSEAAPCPHETSTACTGTGCQGVPAAPPIFATPSSVTFSGPGNFPAPATVVTKKTAKKVVKCGKGKKLSKGRCVKAKPKRKGKPRPKKKTGGR
jgi:hypothetical protein